MNTTNEPIPLPHESEGSLRAGYGNEYTEWKDWSAEAFGTLSTREEADISAQFNAAKTPFPPGTLALDIGFGNGRLLGYGAKRHWQMHGTELNEGLVERARKSGFDAVYSEDLSPFPDSSFNLVVAFDVMEHIPQDQILGFLAQVQRVLLDGGVFLARFPNGDSPFGLQIQNGDPTHLTFIGSMRAEYFANKAGMEIVYLGGEKVPLRAGFPHTAHRLLAIPIRGLMNTFLNLLFCPRDPKAFCSVNLVMILRAHKSNATTG